MENLSREYTAAELKDKLNLSVSPSSTFPRLKEKTSISCSNGTFEITPQLSKKGENDTDPIVLYMVRKIEKTIE